MKRGRCAFALLTLAVCGCGGPDYSQPSGAVTANGRPVETGLILFSPVDPHGPLRSVTAEITGGNYSVPAAKQMAPGEYAVAITGERKTGRKIEADPLSSDTIDEREQFIPEKYNARSELKATVGPGQSKLEFPTGRR